MRYAYPIVAAIAAGTMVVSISVVSADSGFSYMEPVASGVSLKVLATAGDKINGYTLFGIPDGMGVLQDGKNATILMNHELSAADKVAGIAKRANGLATASTVSALNFDTATGGIVGATELLKNISWYDYATGQYGAKPTAPTGAAAKDAFGTANHAIALNRFCSSSTVQPGGLSYKETKDGKSITYGYTGAAYLTTEEGSDESRAFISDTSGNLIQLPRLGLGAKETAVVVPTGSKVTAVMSNEDGAATASQLFMYVGEKTTSGSWTEKAGLTNGKNYVMAVDGYNDDNLIRNNVGKGKALPVNFKELNWNQSGVAQNDEAMKSGTVMARVEDGAFDPKNPNTYYFLTTESDKDPKATAVNPALPKASRDGGALWKLEFNDVKNPLAGAKLTMLLDGSESIFMSKPDNIEVDGLGNILIQEDPGGNDAISRLIAYRISDGKMATVAKFKDVYFTPGGAQFMTNDEENSGVVNATKFIAKAGDTKSYYFLNAQVHVPASKARLDLVGNTSVAQQLEDSIEGGQIYLMTIPNWDLVYNS